MTIMEAGSVAVAMAGGLLVLMGLVPKVVAFTLNLLFNHLGERREPDLLQAP
ncbi:hypothetical protein [Amycolatopsis sp. NPDC102389]|uniref:hypothetical protein n=1 Tax=Amycolatopsis sp. NPDC102389 TaxID=3363941 RepID=UPI003802C486